MKHNLLRRKRVKLKKSQLKELIKHAIVDIISEVVLIEDAHTAVARGCLSEAQLIEEEEDENNEKSA